MNEVEKVTAVRGSGKLSKQRAVTNIIISRIKLPLSSLDLACEKLLTKTNHLYTPKKESHFLCLFVFPSNELITQEKMVKYQVAIEGFTLEGVLSSKEYCEN